MRQEKALPAVSISHMHQYKEYITKSKRVITAISNSIGNIRTNRKKTKSKTKKKKIENKSEKKQLYGYFKRQTEEIARKKTWTWLRKGHLMNESESLPIATQHNAIKINYVKAKIDKRQQNSKCRLCRQRNKTFNLIVSECSKLAQKKTRHD